MVIQPQFMIVRQKAILEKGVEVLASLYGRGIFGEYKGEAEKIYLQEKEIALKEQAI